MVGEQQIVRVVSQGPKAVSSIFTFRRVFFWGVIFTLIAIIFANAISESIRTKSFEPLVNEVGSRLLLVTQNIEDASQEVIDKQGVYNPEGGFFGDTWEVISTFAELIFAMMMFYMWIKVLMFIFSHSFLSENDKWFVNFALSLMMFFILEVIFIITAAAINNEITGAFDVFRLMAIPITSFIAFFKAIPYILSPIANTVGDYIDKSNTTIQNATGAIVNGS